MTKTDSENGRLELENANDRSIISEYPNGKMKSELHNHNPSSVREAGVSKSNSSLSSLNSQGSVNSGNEDSPRRIMGIKWTQGGRSRLGKGTKNLLDKWKTHASKSIDLSGKDNMLSGNPELNESKEEVNGGDMEKKSTWKEHVWSTFIHRGYSDDVTESEPKMDGREFLTEFQIDKFRYFFYHVLDLNNDHVISEEDFLKLNDRIRHYMDWSVNTIQFLALKEVHNIFQECFLYTAAEIERSKTKPEHWDPFSKPAEIEAKCCVALEWLDVWGNLVSKARNIHDLPMWLQYYPKILFDTINRSGSGVISKNELRLFYTAFLDVGKLGEKKIRCITDKAYTAMTSNGDVKLTFHIYKLSFLNFLLGRQPNGPGQFIFGSVPSTSGRAIFTVDYSALNTRDEERETFSQLKLEHKGSRKSIVV
ncbi:uncharacterized protein LOC111705787 isoform X2 [Eurytemora carolleeae]|uniref:uncharacterized protein LOC111705787 isoform X2 n=1 Tax=Eurytemora carolleeae TaxID=1294199 RepID=UPI000C777721|nr:uncharacterized protein LOC111705787 isoform X2 [Eurytemora carolleeae]|eukprot:XP_023334333.1 uncharacterized protein LOC111705787 isoform X2 [Eurytemora affinis]